MNQFKKGDKVRLTKSCYKMPEWERLPRERRKEYSGLAGTVLDYVGPCWYTPDRVHLSRGVCIPDALLVLAEPKKYFVTGMDMASGLDWSAACKATQIVADTTERVEAADTQRSCLTCQRKPVPLHKAPCVNCWGRTDRPDWKIIAPLALTKRTYTPAQIAEARDIVYRLCEQVWTDKNMNGICFFQPANKRCVGVFTTHGSGITGIKETGRASARCSDNDVFDESIGRMVALCKLTGTPLPAWIKGGKS